MQKDQNNPNDVDLGTGIHFCYVVDSILWIINSVIVFPRKWLPHCCSCCYYCYYYCFRYWWQQWYFFCWIHLYRLYHWVYKRVEWVDYIHVLGFSFSKILSTTLLPLGFIACVINFYVLLWACCCSSVLLFTACSTSYCFCFCWFGYGFGFGS